MIKPIVNFVKNLFGSKTPEPVEREAPTLNSGDAWPFPTARPDDVVSTKPVEIPTLTEVVKTAPVAKKTPAKKTNTNNRKKRTFVKRPAETAAPAVSANPPSKDEIKANKLKSPPTKKK